MAKSKGLPPPKRKKFRKRKKISKTTGLSKVIRYRDKTGKFRKQGSKKHGRLYKERYDYRRSITGKFTFGAMHPEFTSLTKIIDTKTLNSFQGKISDAMGAINISNSITSRSAKGIEIQLTGFIQKHGYREKKTFKLSLDLRDIHARSMIEGLTVSRLMKMLYYEGVRPDYPIEIVRDWKQKQESKRATQGRTPLKNVTITARIYR